MPFHIPPPEWGKDVSVLMGGGEETEVTHHLRHLQLKMINSHINFTNSPDINTYYKLT